VLGLARSGQTAVAALVAGGAQVTAWDAKEEPRHAVAELHGDKVVLADPLAIDLIGFAGMVVSPGVPINRHPIADAARRRRAADLRYRAVRPEPRVLAAA
jgi:UDP-N-acetylmuramoylalanine--D-glutamate ligase